MTRFEYRKQPLKPSGFLLSVCVFLLIFFLFVQGISSFSESTKKRQKESLENAIMRNVTYCYTVEGSYPESLDYLKENYGLTYDEDLFFVDYHIDGSNIFPDITIIERGDN
ncbi:MAG: hypothetical protein ACOYBL_06975 [Lachnospiraceae bacterium]|jgi:hypothetical protein